MTLNSAPVRPPTASAMRSSSEPAWMSQIIVYMLDHFADEITLDQLANAVGVSKFNFCRQFHRHHGFPPLKWLWRFRAVLSAELLALPLTWDVQDVAYNCGFTSSAHFCRIFKDTHGVTPTHYRQNARKRRSNTAPVSDDLILVDRDCVVVQNAFTKLKASSVHSC